MTSDSPYVIGHFSKKPSPLARFLPPIPEGIAKPWLQSHLSGSNFELRPWILDPFGSAPHLIREIAESGYRILVAANNPVIRFIIEMTANPPKESQLRSALSELAASYRGEERMEPHIKSLYETECMGCKKNIQADAFLWERGEPTPYARIYTCPFCGDSGEHPAEAKDVQQAQRFPPGGLHRARAIERVVAFDDPDRHHAEEAIDSYLPRAIYVLFTLINKLDAITVNRTLVTALLLSACDQATSLWPYPSQRSRPKLLTIPTRFRENNIWMLLDKAVEQWAGDIYASNLPVTVWPDLPPASGGICLFEGRIRELADYQDEKNNLSGKIGAVISALPRPNQAFWSLSALWAGWLWGRTAAAPFKSVLRRQRYDWSWHCTALTSALESTLPLLEPDTPVFGLLGEVETGFLSSALVAANTAGLVLNNIAVRKSDELAQVVWSTPEINYTPETIEFEQVQESLDRSALAAISYLTARKEPSGFLPLLGSSLTNLFVAKKFTSSSENSMWELHSKISSSLQQTFNYRKGFIRYGGSEYSLDVGQWWLKEGEDELFPWMDRSGKVLNYSDSIEISLVNYLVDHTSASLLDLDNYVCTKYPGLMTPDHPIIKTCVASYARQDNDEVDLWSLREEDRPLNRKAEIKNIAALLEGMGLRCGFTVQRGTKVDRTQELPLLLIGQDKEIAYVFYIQASALLLRSLINKIYSPKVSILVFPGSRSSLIDFKIKNNPFLNLIIENGWRFLKFRQVRAMSQDEQLTPEKLASLLQEDPIVRSDG